MFTRSRLPSLWPGLLVLALTVACDYELPLNAFCIDPTDTGKPCGSVPQNPTTFYYNVAINAGAAQGGTASFAPDPATAGAATSAVYPFRWMNFDTVPHHLVSDAPLFDTGDIAAGSVVNVRFARTGTFTYHCTIHPIMAGTITVTP